MLIFYQYYVLTILTSLLFKILILNGYVVSSSKNEKLLKIHSPPLIAFIC